VNFFGQGQFLIFACCRLLWRYFQEEKEWKKNCFEKGKTIYGCNFRDLDVFGKWGSKLGFQGRFVTNISFIP